MAHKLRLICPNCDAQYEVDESVIPEAGREVQCSNCNETWWQTRAGVGSKADHDAAHAVAGGATETPPAPASVPMPEAASEPAPVPETAGAGPSAGAAAPAPQPDPHRPEAAEEDDTGADDDAALAAALGPVAAAASAAPARRSLDEAVLDVLRQEAERESKARQSEVIETQPGLGVNDGLGRGDGEREAAVRKRMAMLRGLDADGTEDEDAALAAGRSRGTKLPNVDEINSTLGSRGEESDAPTDVSVDRQRRRSGFRAGFVITVGTAGLLALIYGFSDQIAARVPSLEPRLEVYRESVDAARVWLDTAALNASEAIEGLTEGN